MGLAALIEILWATSLAIRYEFGRLLTVLYGVLRVGHSQPVVQEPREDVSLSLRPTRGWRVIYFDAANRGECLRLILACQGVPFEDLRLEFPQGLAPYKSAVLGDASPLAFDLAPVVQHATDDDTCVNIANTAAAAQYVGLSTGLAPSDAVALSLATSATISIQEMYDQLYYGSWLARYFCSAICPGRKCCRVCVCYPVARWRMLWKHKRWFDTWERWLRTQPVGEDGITFLAGGALSFADLCLFDCVEAGVQCPRLTTFERRGSVGSKCSTSGDSVSIRRCSTQVEGFEACGYIGPDERQSYPRTNALLAYCATRPAVAEYLRAREPRFERAPPKGFFHPPGPQGATPWGRTAARRAALTKKGG